MDISEHIRATYHPWICQMRSQCTSLVLRSVWTTSIQMSSQSSSHRSTTVVVLTRRATRFSSSLVARVTRRLPKHLTRKSLWKTSVASCRVYLSRSRWMTLTIALSCRKRATTTSKMSRRNLRRWSCLEASQQWTKASHRCRLRVRIHPRMAAASRYMNSSIRRQISWWQTMLCCRRRPQKSKCFKKQKWRVLLRAHESRRITNILDHRHWVAPNAFRQRRKSYIWSMAKAHLS